MLESEDRELMGVFANFWRERGGGFTPDWPLSKMGGSFVVRYRLKLLAGIVHNWTRLEDCEKYVEWMNATEDKMVGENKGKKGKEHGLSWGMNRNSTKNMEKTTQ